MATPEKVKLKLSEIGTDPLSFQHRHGGIDRNHVKELVRALKINKKPLDPIWDWVDPVTGRYTVISGHHRLEAYRSAKWRRVIPAAVFKCDKRDAVLLSVEGNKKTHKPLTASERTDAAWKLVVDGSYSKREIVTRAVVADGTVAKMRRVKNTLLEAKASEGTAPEDIVLPEYWGCAMREAKGIIGDEWALGDEDELNAAKADELDEKIGTDFRCYMDRYTDATMLFLYRSMSQGVIKRFAEDYADLETCGYVLDDDEEIEDGDDDEDGQPF